MFLLSVLVLQLKRDGELWGMCCYSSFPLFMIPLWTCDYFVTSSVMAAVTSDLFLLTNDFLWCYPSRKRSACSCILLFVNHYGWGNQWKCTHVVQCKYRSSSITAVSLVMNLCTLRLLISIFYSVKTEIIRGQATLQLGVSGSCCCHAVIPSVVEDNKDSPNGHRGQHLEKGQEGTEGKGQKSKRYNREWIKQNKGFELWEI